MNPTTFLNVAIRPTLRWMGEPFDNALAERILLAIAMQESDMEHRHQVGGPAHGFFQFEPIGCAEAIRIDGLNQTRFFERLVLPTQYDELHVALEWSEAAMVVCARLILWSITRPLPGPHEQADAWRQYIRAWKPGKPHPDRWPANWALACEACEAVDGVPVETSDGGWW